MITQGAALNRWRLILGKNADGIHQGGAHLMRGTAQRRMGAKHFSAAIRRVGVGVHG